MEFWIWFRKYSRTSLIQLVIVGLGLTSALSLKAETYMSLDSAVKSLQNRVAERRKKIKELGEKKAGMKDEAQIRAVLDEMVVEAREMKKNFVDFQTEKKRLKYQFPSQGDETERRYRRFELETIEELNSVSNIDIRLRGLLSKIQKTYEKPPEAVERDKKKKEEQRRASKAIRPKDEETGALNQKPVLKY